MDRKVADSVLRIIADQALLDVGDIRPEATLDELGMDSLAMAETVFALEERFDIRIPFSPAAADGAGGAGSSDSGPMQGRVADVVALVEGLVAARRDHGA